MLAKHVLPPEKCIWIDGGAIGEEDDLWDEVVGQLDLFQTKEISEKSDMTGTATGKAAIEGSAIIAEASGEISGSVATTTGSTEVAKRSVSSRTAALAGLRAGRKALVIDDFHYLSKDLQGTVVRALKALIFDGIPVGIIAIPHRRYDAMKVEKEMTGRIEPITIPVWELQELRFIPEIGFPKLGYRLAENVIDRFAAESIGSPHLMQDFCRTLCRRRDLNRPQTLCLKQGTPK